MDASAILEFQQKYLEIVWRIVLANIDRDRFSVYLFGSWARQQQRQSSDIDIGIWGNRPLGSIYHRIMNGIEESAVPYPVDIVDLSTANPDFRKEALKGARIWNRAKDSVVDKMEQESTQQLKDENDATR